MSSGLAGIAPESSSSARIRDVDAVRSFVESAKLRFSATARRAGWIGWVLVLAPVVLALCYVCHYGVNVMWEDQWGSIALFDKYDAGTLTFGDFWMWRNEHRMVIPHIIIFLLAFATRWNAMAEMMVSQVGLLAMLAIFLSVLYRECRSPYRQWFMIPIAFLTMSVRQSQNLLNGLHLCLIVPVAAALAALFCLYLMNQGRWLQLKFAGAVAIGTAANFSGGYGPLVWIAGLAPLALLPLGRRSKITFAIIWAVLGVIEWKLYFWGFQSPPGHPPFGFSLQYWLAIIGSPLFPVLLMATTVGSIILLFAAISTLATIAEGKGARYSFWIGIVVYGLLVDGVTTVARSGFGVSQALASRYTTYSVLVIIGIYGILTCLLIESRSRFVSALWGGLVSLIVSGMVISTSDGFQFAAADKLAKEYQAFVLSTADTQPDDVLAGATHSQEPRAGGAALLQRHGWSVFAPGEAADRYAAPPATLPVLPAGARIGLNQFAILKGTNYLTVNGWATDPEGNDVVGGLFLEIDGRLYPTFYGMPSPGLGQFLANERVEREKVAGGSGKGGSSPLPASDRVEKCGFMRAFLPGLLTKGHHRLTVKALTPDRNGFYAPLGPVDFAVE